MKIATNREKACPSERGDRDNFVGVVDDTDCERKKERERELSREMISKRGAKARGRR